MWEKKNDYYIKNGDWTIAKVKINETTTYEVWIASQQHCGFLTAAAAKQFVDESQK